MTHKQKLTMKDTAKILGRLSIASISRLSLSDKTFPRIEITGRSKFIDADALYQWLSKKAGVKVTSNDKILRSRDLQEYFSKSHTWLWLNVKNNSLPKPFKINRTNFWLESQIVGNIKLEGVA